MGAIKNFRAWHIILMAWPAFLMIVIARYLELGIVMEIVFAGIGGAMISVLHLNDVKTLTKIAKNRNKYLAKVILISLLIVIVLPFLGSVIGKLEALLASTIFTLIILKI
jgi:amino acid transporter